MFIRVELMREKERDKERERERERERDSMETNIKELEKLVRAYRS